MPANNIETRLWDAADELRANSRLQASEYFVPVEGIIFLRQADYRFSKAEAQIASARAASSAAGRVPPITADDFRANGVLYLPPEARWAYLLGMPEGQNIGKALNDAMRAIEAHNPDLTDALPKTYQRLESPTLASLLRLINGIDLTAHGDALGTVYEYFLGKFAMTEGQHGGEFYTPSPIVRLMVEIVEPRHGRLLDPANGSGGMFIHSAAFVRDHGRDPAAELSIFGMERVAHTVRRCKRNLAVHGLQGNIRQANSYYEDPHRLAGRFDYLLSNPPFNVNKIDKDRIKNDYARFPFGMPTIDNGNYIWIQLFYAALNETGRAGFVMANSASDARGSELDIRKKLIQSGAVDVIVAIGSNFFYTVTLPCTLWFLDRGKGGTDRRDKVLFLDARHIYTQIDRAHREFSPSQIEFLSNIVRLYRGLEPETTQGSTQLIAQHFPSGAYQDVPGLCRVATLAEIEAQGWSLNPGRYVGVRPGDEEDFDFVERLAELHAELEGLNAEAYGLEARISETVAQLLAGGEQGEP